jgi:hypothetical protein
MPCRVSCAALLLFGLALAAHAEPPAERPVADAAPPECAAPAAPAAQLEWCPRFDATRLLKEGDRGFGITDLEGQLEIRVPLSDDLPPVKITPGAAVRLWEGPTFPFPFRGFRPDLPDRVYDLYADVSWRPRPAEWLFLDLKLTPGIYSDFTNLGHEAFRPRGHALAIVALSEEFQMIGGLLWTNRLRTRVLPAGGVRWAPTEDTEFRLVFPVPRISHRILTRNGTKYSVYLAGEFGGGAWAIRREDGRDDTVDYSDLRLLAGLEAERPTGLRCHAEAGYVFGRRIDYASNRPSPYDPPDTVLFRVGFSY